MVSMTVPTVARPGAEGPEVQGLKAAALERFLEFQEAWGRKYPAVIRLFESAWAEFVPFLNFDVEIRRIVLFHKRHRVDQCPDTPGRACAGSLPERADSAGELPLFAMADATPR
jgi:hypothetical protein